MHVHTRVNDDMCQLYLHMRTRERACLGTCMLVFVTIRALARAYSYYFPVLPVDFILGMFLLRQ